MQLELRHNGELIGTLASKDRNIEIISCVEAFRRGFQNHIDRGINLSGDFAVFNTQPGVDGNVLLKNMAELYKRMYRFTSEFKE